MDRPCLHSYLIYMLTLINVNKETFCSTMLKLINDREVLSDKYFISNNGPLHKIVRGDDILFQALLVPVFFSKFILHQVHDALGHNGTARNNQCLK